MSIESILEFLLELAILFFVTWRVARVLTQDVIFESVREFIWLRFPEMASAYTDSQVKDAMPTEDGSQIARVKSWPFKRYAQYVNGPDGYWWPVVEKDGEFVRLEKDYKIGYLFSCMDCMPLYTGTAATFIYYAQNTGTSILNQAFIAITVAAIAMIFDRKSISG